MTGFPFTFPAFCSWPADCSRSSSGFSHADTTAWRNPFTVGLLVAGVVLLAAFAYFETWAECPLLPPRIVLLHGVSPRDRVQLVKLLVRLEASILSADQPG